MKLITIAILWSATLFAIGPVANAASFYNSLVANEINTFEDQNRESIVDLDGSNTLSVADVFFGFVRLDNRSQPLPGVSLPSGDVYAVFTIESTAVNCVNPTTVVCGNAVGTNNYTLSFQPTQSAAAVGLGLDLSSLTPGGLPATEPGTPAAALYEMAPPAANQIDLIATSPGDQNGDNLLNMFDFTDRIAQGNLDLIIGFGGGVTEGDDHWSAQVSILAAVDPFQNYNLLNNLTLAGGIPGLNGFHAGLSILFNSAADFAETVVDPQEGLNTLHELTIQNGGISGASDLLYPNCLGCGGGATVNPFFFTFPGTNINAFGVSSNADFNVAPIPEPAVIAMLGLGLAGLAAAGRRRRRSV